MTDEEFNKRVTEYFKSPGGIKGIIEGYSLNIIVYEDAIKSSMDKGNYKRTIIYLNMSIKDRGKKILMLHC